MTQKLTHTPGPWKLVKTTKGWFLRTMDGCVLGGINRFPAAAELSSQCEPNARLIRCTPELFDALLPFANAHESWSGGDTSRHFGHSVTPADFQRAAQVVAKARGGL